MSRCNYKSEWSLILDLGRFDSAVECLTILGHGLKAWSCACRTNYTRQSAHSTNNIAQIDIPENHEAKVRMLRPTPASFRLSHYSQNGAT
ncbi:hypothetical protein DSO57_1038410 [Entomophthora muscae]|uniref:Uncharacterized protein n=1 Tax=Entomophthora muscae TaxID=34485 RepID=A0ACC2U7P7_9FUNG|nr:hypothetical protein DSO57_1038410 [Entomophthora muscae]